MGREGRDYWEAQLSEYWDSGLTIQEYSELKELSYESTRRWIRVEDAEQLAGVHIRSWEKAYCGLLPDSAIHAIGARRRQQWDEFLCRSDFIHYVSERDGIITGFVGICPYRDEEHSPAGEIGGLYVAPEYWSCGIGTALLHCGVQHLLQSMRTPVYLWVLESNSRARAFYEKNLFRQDGAIKKVIIGTPQIELRYCYGKM